MKKRTITESTKKKIAGKQHYKCANSPTKQLAGLTDYKCPLWQIIGQNQGLFDESGYEIDHITEFSVTQNDDDNNLQALCLCCHNVKTKRFNAINKKLTKKPINKPIKNKPVDKPKVVKGNKKQDTVPKTIDSSSTSSTMSDSSEDITYSLPKTESYVFSKNLQNQIDELNRKNSEIWQSNTKTQKEMLSKLQFGYYPNGCKF
jgi:hypothetical protein